ncbi:MAG: DUF6882 domain-containing protein [Cyanobacteria bacterium J06632_3]
MFSWFSKLMAGDQSAVPNGADVERDEQGRVTRVEQTLSLSSDTAKPAPVPIPSPAFQADLFKAASALIEKNISLIKTYCVGLENNYGFDQETGKFTLFFSDGRQLIADGQILGSFDPRQKTFLWGWANPSLSPKISALANDIKRVGDARSESILTTPEMALKFDVISQLMAFAVDGKDYDGVYRAITNGQTSVFIAFRVSELLSAEKNNVDANDFRGSPWTQENIDAADAIVTAYNKEMCTLDAKYQEKTEENATKETGSEIMRQLLTKKVAVYNQYWRRDDDYWKPCSFGWPSNHDATQYRVSISAADGMGDLLVGHVAGPFGVQKQLYRIELFQEGPKIVDSLMDWGKGFMWPPEQ